MSIHSWLFLLFLVAAAAGFYLHKRKIDTLGRTLEGLAREHQGSYTPPPSFFDFPQVEITVEGEPVTVAGRRGAGKKSSPITAFHWEGEGAPEGSFAILNVRFRHMMESGFAGAMFGAMGRSPFGGANWVDLGGPFGERFGVLCSSEELVRAIFDDELRMRILDAPAEWTLQLNYNRGEGPAVVSTRGISDGLTCALSPLAVQSAEVDWLVGTGRLLIRKLKAQG